MTPILTESLAVAEDNSAGGVTEIFYRIILTITNEYYFSTKEYQKQMENFDQSVAHITTWMYRAEILLDESEKQQVGQKEEVLKVNPQ